VTKFKSENERTEGVFRDCVGAGAGASHISGVTKKTCRRLNSPKISERPHSKMFDRRVLLLFRQFAILSRPTWSPRATRRFGLIARRGGVANDFMAVHLFLVSLGTRRTRPPVTTRGLRGQGRLNTPHMEEVLTPIAFHGILSVCESQFGVQRNGETRESETHGAHHC